MDETNFPEWLKWMGPTGAAILGLGLYLRQYLSGAKVDRAADDANVATILRLQDELRQERERADKLMIDREQMITELGQLRGEVAALRSQVEILTKLIRQQNGDE